MVGVFLCGVPFSYVDHLFLEYQGWVSMSHCYNLDDLIGLKCTATVGTSDKTDRKEAKPADEQYSVIRNMTAIDEREDDGAISH